MIVPKGVLKQSRKQWKMESIIQIYKNMALAYGFGIWSSKINS